MQHAQPLTPKPKTPEEIQRIEAEIKAKAVVKKDEETKLRAEQLKKAEKAAAKEDKATKSSGKKEALTDAGIDPTWSEGTSVKTLEDFRHRDHYLDRIEINRIRLATEQGRNEYSSRTSSLFVKENDRPDSDTVLNRYREKQTTMIVQVAKEVFYIHRKLKLSQSNIYELLYQRLDKDPHQCIDYALKPFLENPGHYAYADKNMPEKPPEFLDSYKAMMFLHDQKEKALAQATAQRNQRARDALRESFINRIRSQNEDCVRTHISNEATSHQQAKNVLFGILDGYRKAGFNTEEPPVVGTDAIVMRTLYEEYAEKVRKEQFQQKSSVVVIQTGKPSVLLQPGQTAVVKQKLESAPKVVAANEQKATATPIKTVVATLAKAAENKQENTPSKPTVNVVDLLAGVDDFSFELDPRSPKKQPEWMDFFAGAPANGVTSDNTPKPRSLSRRNDSAS
jgi:hypothetical protein